MLVLIVILILILGLILVLEVIRVVPRESDSAPSHTSGKAVRFCHSCGEGGGRDESIISLHCCDTWSPEVVMRVKVEDGILLEVKADVKVEVKLEFEG